MTAGATPEVYAMAGRNRVAQSLLRTAYAYRDATSYNDRRSMCGQAASLLVESFDHPSEAEYAFIDLVDEIDAYELWNVRSDSQGRCADLGVKSRENAEADVLAALFEAVTGDYACQTCVHRHSMVTFVGAAEPRSHECAVCRVRHLAVVA